MRDLDALGLESEAEQLERAAQRADRDAERSPWFALAVAVTRAHRDAVLAAHPPVATVAPDAPPTAVTTTAVPCRACGLSDCAGGMSCLGSAAWD